MKDEVIKCINDIAKAIDAIDRFIGERKEFTNFKNNELVRRAVEREFEIIGEAINRIKKYDGSLQITNAKQIINLRNYIIHAYDTVDYEILWSIIVNHLPKLKIEVNETLKSR
jgi:uncharacterized protein with HEPN domain